MISTSEMVELRDENNMRYDSIHKKYKQHSQQQLRTVGGSEGEAEGDRVGEELGSTEGLLDSKGVGSKVYVSISNTALSYIKFPSFSEAE
jgi:hypothetical protein